MKKNIKLLVGVLLCNVGLATAQVDSLNTNPLTLTVEKDILSMDVEVTKKELAYTPSLKHETVFQTPLSTYIISEEQIINSGALSIVEALRLAPNVIVRQSINGNYEVYIRNSEYSNSQSGLREMTNTSTLVLINKMPVNDGLNGEVFWDALSIDINDVKKIEIISGASGMLYGKNAVSGIIHIVTKEEEDNALKINANVQGGTNSTLIQNGALSFGVKEKLKVRLSGNYRSVKRFDNSVFLLDGIRPLVGDSLLFYDANAEETNLFTRRARQSYGVNGFVSYSDGKNIKLSLNSFIQDSDVQTITPDVGQFSLVQRNVQSNRFQFNANLYKWEVDAAYSLGYQNLAEGHEGYEFNTDQLNAGLAYNYNPKALPNLRIRPGIYYSTITMDDTDYPVTSDDASNLFGGAVSLTNYGASTLVDATFFKKLRVETGVRYDQYEDIDQSFISYMGAATYQIHDKHIIRASFANAYKSPFLRNSFMNKRVTDNGLTQYYQANNNLNLQQTQTMELGYRTTIAQQFDIDFAGFYNQTGNFTGDSLITTDITTPMNFGVNTKQMGATLNFQVHLVKLNAGVWGTFQQTEIENGTSTTANQLAPSLWGGAYLNYFMLNSRLSFYVDGHYYGKQLFVNKYGAFETDSKIISNAKVSYKVWRNNIVYLNARNAFGAQQRELPLGDLTDGVYLLGINFEL